MGYAREHKTQSHIRMVDAAMALASQHGLRGLSIDSVMKAADLTHGAFYAHFPSREAMLVHVVETGLKRESERLERAHASIADPTVQDVIKFWLDWDAFNHQEHRFGVCLLLGEANFASDSIRRVVASEFENRVRFVARVLGGGHSHRERAISIMTSIVGSVSVARSLDSALARSFLSAAEIAIGNI